MCGRDWYPFYPREALLCPSQLSCSTSADGPRLAWLLLRVLQDHRSTHRASWAWPEWGWHGVWGHLPIHPRIWLLWGTTPERWAMKRRCWNCQVLGASVIPGPHQGMQFVNADAWLCTNTHVAEALGLAVEIWKVMVAGNQVCFPLYPLSTEFPSCVHCIAKEQGRAA